MTSPWPARLRAATEGESFDRYAVRLGDPGAVVAALLAGAPPELVAAARVHLTGAGGGRADVAALYACAPVGSWVCCEWAAGRAAAHRGPVPAPFFERWDALLDMSRARPEAPWLALRVFAAARPAALARRALIGMDRRFGARWRPLGRLLLVEGGARHPAALRAALRRGAPRPG